jgi:metal-sulfur cluster biosynthetic enzyme
MTNTTDTVSAARSDPADRPGRGTADPDAHGAAPTVASGDETAEPGLGASVSAAVTDPGLVADIEEALKDVVDPELGINIVDLGLVYDLQVDPANVATIDMTLTSAACPLTDMIEDQVAAALVEGPDGGLVADFRINWVWLPPWGPERITEDGREQMRALGFNI